MSSSQSLDHFPGEEAYYTAEEDRSCYAQSSSGASSIVPITPNRSVYATANQTPTASPDINRGTASSFPMVAQDQAQSEGLRPMEGSPKKSRETAPSDATFAPRKHVLTHRAEASTYVGRQRAFLLRLSRSGESKKEENAPDSGSRSSVNDSLPTDPADPLKNKYIARRETSNFSYVYRPTPIDVHPQHSSPPTSQPPTITTSPAASNRTTTSHQGLDPIEEDEMPYDSLGNFIMNPLAPVFVPRQGGQPSRGGQPSQGSEPVQGGRPGATRVHSPQDWMEYGVGQPSAGSVTESPTSSPPTPSRMPLYGAAHSLFYEPRTALFTGDGPPRTTPHRPDGSLPSQPDPDNDFLTNRQYSPASRAADDDQLHIQSRREYVDRMAGFGQNGPVQRFRIARPTPAATAAAQQQERSRVLVQRGDGQGQGQGQGSNEGFFDHRTGHGMQHTAQPTNEDEDEDEGSGAREGIYTTTTMTHRRRRPGPNNNSPNAEETGTELSSLDNSPMIARGEREGRADHDADDDDEDDEETVVDAEDAGRWYVGPTTPTPF